MLRPISNIYLVVNGQSINVGKVVADYSGDAWWNSEQKYLTNSEVKELQRNFEIGDQQIDDLVYHCVGKFENFIATTAIEEKWINELIDMGYNVEEKLFYEIKE